MKLPQFKDLDRLVLIYLATLFLLFVLVIETPYIVSGGVYTLSEELVELTMLAILLIIGSIIYSAYHRELEQKNRAYVEMTKHVGIVNRQMQHVKNLARLVTRIPESKSDLKSLLSTIGEKSLDIVPSDWAVIRIVDSHSGNTLAEQSKARGSAVLLKYQISNDDLLSGIEQPDFTVVSSHHENISIRAFCIMSSTAITEEQMTLINALVNEAVLLYLIYTSIYFKN